MKNFIRLVATGCLAAAPAAALAGDNVGAVRTAGTGAEIVIAPTVVPEAELKAALGRLTAGAPTKTSGVGGLKKLGTVPLDGEFDSVSGRVLRTREIVFKPGAVVALHRHQGRPGVAYIIEGEMTEYRIGADGRATTAVKKAGETALERTGVVHWWKNASGRIARTLVVDIVPAK